MSADAGRVERHTWEAEDFQPVVEHGGWLVALMNWSPRFDPSGWGVLERHTHTDEVFVLLRGQAVLLSAAGGALMCEEMAPGVVYNVTQATWHNVIGTREAQWLIVESTPDDTAPTEYRTLDEVERAALAAAFPAWLAASGSPPAG